MSVAGCANTTARCRRIGRGFGAMQAPIGAQPFGTGDFALINFAKGLERIFGYVLRFLLVLNAKSPRQNSSE